MSEKRVRFDPNQRVGPLPNEPNQGVDLAGRMGFRERDAFRTKGDGPFRLQRRSRIQTPDGRPDGDAQAGRPPCECFQIS